LAPATRYGYQRLLERNILPALGSAKLSELQPEQVRTWHAELTHRCGHDQAAKSYRLLRALMNTALDDERIGRNPCRLKGAGVERAAERPMVPTGEVLALIEAMPARYRIVALLGGLGGLRTGESLGLQRQDIDPLRSCVHVRREAQEIPGLGRIVKEPKSEAGRRTVVLPKEAMRALVEHLEAFGHAETGELVTDARGRPARRARISEAWQAAKATTGSAPGLRMHDLRHHAATLMARMPGITTKELMAQIGHASPRAALIYQHATEERAHAVASFMSEQLAAAQADTPAEVVRLRST